MRKKRKILWAVVAAVAGSVLALVLMSVYVAIQARTRARRVTTSDRNAYELCQQIFDPENDLSARLRLFPRILEMEAYVPPKDRRTGPAAVTSLLEMQVLVKVVRVVAVFQMIEGKREESLELCAASYRLGQLMSDAPMLIDRLIGMGLRGIASVALETYALNCCETEAEFKQLWEMLDRLEKRQKSHSRLEIATLESPNPVVVFMIWRNSREIKTRMDMADSRFELVRMATATKYRLVTEGAFPASKKQFAPLLPKGPPKDPFSGDPLKFLSTPDALACYSVGPDGRDDRAAIEYDPTNGTVSPGDILLRVPLKRQFPFPRDGVRAVSVEDLMRQFPNGFPVDPYATTKGKSLGTTPTVAGGIYIYSYGPDVDEFRGPFTGTSHVLECPYDPTNGTTSEGDLFIRILPP